MSNWKTIGLVIGVSLLVCLGSAYVPFDPGVVGGWLTGAFAVAAVFSFLWRVHSGRGIATAIGAVYAFFCLWCFMQWAAWYQ